MISNVASYLLKEVKANRPLKVKLDITQGQG